MASLSLVDQLSNVKSKILARRLGEYRDMIYQQVYPHV